MNVSTDWKKLGKKAALQGISLTAELFNDVAVELNKLADTIGPEQQPCSTASQQAETEVISEHSPDTP